MPTREINGLELCIEDWGAPDADPLLLIMGLGAQLVTWPPGFCSALLDQGFRVVRFDNRDAGLSSKSTGTPPSPLALLAAAASGQAVEAPYTLSDMAADAVGVLDALEIPAAHIVGASLGGMIAQMVAIDHPHRVASLTSIMSTTGAPDVGRGTPEAFGALTRPVPTDRGAAIEQGVEVGRIISGPRFDPVEARARTAESYDRCPDHPAGPAFQLAAIAATGDRTARLGAVGAPTLVVHGRVDPLIGLSGGEATAAAIPGAELLVLDDMGHDLPAVHWPTIAAAIGTLRGRAARR